MRIARDGSTVRQVNGDNHTSDPTALAKAVMKLESAPVPIADTSSDPICYCPECGARLRAVASETTVVTSATGNSSTSKASRTTLVDWVPGGKSMPSSATNADDDNEPTRVVRGSAELDVAAAPKLEPPTSPRKPPVPTRQKLPSEDDEDYTTRIRRVEDLRLRPSQSVDANEPIHCPPQAVELHDSKEAIANAPPTVELRDRDGAIANAPPTVELRDPDGAIANAPPTVELRDPNGAIASLSPTTIAQRNSDLALQHPGLSPRRKGAILFPILGLGLGIAVAGGLVFLMYGNTTSSGRGRPTAAIEADRKLSSNTFAAQIPSATGSPSAAEPAALPTSSAAAAEPALAEDSKRGDQSTASTAATRKSTDATRVRGMARTTAVAETESAGTNDDATDTDSTRRSASSTLKAPGAKAAAAEEDESDGPTFDSEAAAGALESAAQRASSCRQPTDPSGVARVTVTFAPSGRVTTANIAGPPFVGTPTGSCIATIMRSATVPAFSGSNITVRKTVTIL